jgi:hypothetical protein
LKAAGAPLVQEDGKKAHVQFAGRSRSPALAKELMLAIIGILHFNKKVDVTNALLRISDSLAYGAVARHVYGAVDDQENASF